MKRRVTRRKVKEVVQIPLGTKSLVATTVGIRDITKETARNQPFVTSARRRDISHMNVQQAKISLRNKRKRRMSLQLLLRMTKERNLSARCVFEQREWMM